MGTCNWQLAEQGAEGEEQREVQRDQQREVQGDEQREVQRDEQREVQKDYSPARRRVWICKISNMN